MSLNRVKCSAKTEPGACKQAVTFDPRSSIVTEKKSIDLAKGREA